MSFSACIGNGFSAPERCARRLLEPSGSDAPLRTNIATFPGGAFGVAVRTDRPPVPFERLLRARSGSILAVAGIPTCAATRDVQSELQALVEEDCETAIRALTSFDGAFFAAFYHAPSHVVVLISDSLGALPVYFTRDARGLAFATTLRAFPATGLAAMAPDPAGWGAFIGAKHLIGDHTSVAGVERYPAAAVLTYDMAADRISTRTWWCWPEPDDRVTLDRVDTGEIVETISESASRYLTVGVPAILPLSGGFESRLLAGILTRAGERPVALSVANPYEHHEIEARFAAAVARELRLPFERAEPPADFFSTPAYLAYVRASDVESTSVNLFIAKLDAELLRRRACASWDGVVYGLFMKDFSDTPATRLIERYLSPDAPAWQAARRVFTPAFVDTMREALRVAAAREASRYPDSPEGHTLFRLQNRGRRRVLPNPLKVFGRHALPLMPGFTRDCVARLWRIPVREKNNLRLYRRIFEEHYSSLARIPFCSHGTLLPGTSRSLPYGVLSARSRIVQHPRIGAWLRRVGAAPDGTREPSPVAIALARVDLSGPYLDAERVRRLQAAGASRDPAHVLARELVFYWDAWTRVMSETPL